ncbi:MAG: hypothetical protein GY926_00625 [bacterium]|nr:hypothetical protein [bacterium]
MAIDIPDHPLGSAGPISDSVDWNLLLDLERDGDVPEVASGHSGINVSLPTL